MGQGDDLQATEEEAEQTLIEDLLVLSILVLHHGVGVQGQALAEQLTTVALEVLGLSGSRLAGTSCRLLIVRLERRRSGCGVILLAGWLLAITWSMEQGGRLSRGLDEGNRTCLLLDRGPDLHLFIDNSAHHSDQNSDHDQISRLPQFDFS